MQALPTNANIRERTPGSHVLFVPSNGPSIYELVLRDELLSFCYA